MRRWCPAVIISSCLSLHFKGTVARLCRLNRCVSIGEITLFFLFGMRQCVCVWFWVGIGYYNAIYANWLLSWRPKGQALLHT